MQPLVNVNAHVVPLVNVLSATGHMPLTAEAEHLLERFKRAGVRSYDQMSVLEARATVMASTALQGLQPGLAEVDDLLVCGADGQLPVRLYRPSVDPGLQLLVYFHGG